jgi:hypothetical protein
MPEVIQVDMSPSGAFGIEGFHVDVQVDHVVVYTWTDPDA